MAGATYPGAEHDQLFHLLAIHKHWKRGHYATCDACAPSDDPDCRTVALEVYAAIGCNDIIRLGLLLDSGQQHVLNLHDRLPSIIMKGVCNYADSHKNKKWQPYAALMAAVSMKVLLHWWAATSKSGNTDEKVSASYPKGAVNIDANYSQTLALNKRRLRLNLRASINYDKLHDKEIRDEKHHGKGLHNTRSSTGHRQDKSVHRTVEKSREEDKVEHKTNISGADYRPSGISKGIELYESEDYQRSRHAKL
ncbi:hypothetical protein F5Y16DRAFT_424704 [Xylariaceae sp. FL0255]|nr:hypothetical protein F5Y16DRAFT_424704 [Xylariaceae sp. FL0255]